MDSGLCIKCGKIDNERKEQAMDVVGYIILSGWLVGFVGALIEIKIRKM